MNTALICLAANVYYESRGEPIAGQIAVAHVTMNRAVDKDKVCDVVLEPHQFSWTSKRVKKRHIVTASLPKDVEAWNRALLISQAVMLGAIPDFTKGSRFYHEKTHHPSWRHLMTKTASIGNHTFYREGKSNE